MLVIEFQPGQHAGLSVTLGLKVINVIVPLIYTSFIYVQGRSEPSKVVWEGESEDFT